MTELVFVLLNYRTPELTLEAARSLPAEDAAVVVVDNGSGDDSAERLLALAPDAAERPAEGGALHAGREASVLLLPDNRGYGRGNDAGIRAALEEYDPARVVVMNPDARMGPGALARGLEVAQRPRVGLVGFRAAPPGPPSLDDRLLGRAAAVRLEEDLYRVPWTTGSITVLTRAAIDALHAARGCVYHPDLFLYVDEPEVGCYARRLGFDVLQVVTPDVGHESGQSVREVTSPIREYYGARNKVLVARMPHVPAVAGAVAVHALRSLAEAGVHTLRGDGPRRRAVLAGLRDGLRGRTGKWELNP